MQQAGSTQVQLLQVTSTQPDKTLTPAYLYKYRPMNCKEAVERVEQIVLRDEIYFASAASFNDPFDLNPVFSLDAPPEKQREDFIRLSRKFSPSLTDEQHEAEAEKVMTTSLAPSDIKFTANVIQFMYREVITGSIGTFCVSEKRDDLLMWAHYADSHRGVCLEFDGLGPLMAQAQRVDYSPTRNAINHYTDDRSATLAKALLTKSDHWAYEAEWRLLRTEKGPGRARFRPQNLTGIVIGALAPRETLETVRRWASQRATPVALYRTSTSNKEFKLLVETIN